MENNKILRFIRDFSILLIIFIIFLLISIYLIGSNETKPKKEHTKELEKIIKNEISIAGSITNNKTKKNCLWYSNYYNQSFRKYKGMDVRWENRNVDICNNQQLCDNLHTFIMLGYLGNVCIVDQTQYACIDILNGKFKNGT